MKSLDQKKFEIMDQAIKEGDIKQIKECLEQGFEPNTKHSRYSYTLLSQATFCNYKEMVELLIRYGANPNEVDRNGITPLMDAAYKDYLEICKILLEANADLEMVEKEFGMNALIEASRGGNVEIVKMLIERGTNLHVQDHDGWTALHYACSRGYKDIVLCLVENGANVHFRSDDGDTPLQEVKDCMEFGIDTGPLKEIMDILFSYGARDLL